MAKFTLVAYFLWLVLGYFGVHHFYLGRDKQGILWLTTFGGFFYVGWIRDFYRIPAYVHEANNDRYFLELLGAEMRYYRRPSIWKNIHRVIGQVLFGYFYRALIHSAIPEEYYNLTLLTSLLLPMGSAVGTYLVSNIGSIKSPFKYSIFGAYLGELLVGETHLLTTTPMPSFAVGFSMLFSTLFWKYDRRPRGHLARKPTCCKRFKVWAACFLIFSALCGCYVYFNLSVNTKDGETVKVREVIHNFFKSPHWQRLKHSTWKVWEDYQRDGWEGAKKRLTIIADFEGEDRARTILGVDSKATLKEVKEKYRELAKVWHPDKHKGEDKEHANEKFMELKEAYEILTKIYNKREKHDRKMRF